MVFASLRTAFVGPDQARASSTPHFSALIFQMNISLRRFLLLALLLLTGVLRTQAQGVRLDSLRQVARQPNADTSRVLLYCLMSDEYWTMSVDSAEAYARRALSLAQRIGYRHGEGEALNRLGAALRESNLARALDLFQQSLRIAESLNDKPLQAQNLRSIGIIYVYLRDRQQGLANYFRALRLGEELHDEHRVGIELSNIGLAYDLFDEPDSAYYYQERAYQLAQRLGTRTNYILYGLGNVARKKKQWAKARSFYRQSFAESEEVHHLRSSNFACVGLATLYQQIGKPDSSIYYARLGCIAAQKNGFLRGVLNASKLLTENFKARGPADSTLKYQSLMLAMKDTLFGQEKVMRLQTVKYKEQQREQQVAAAQTALKARYRTYGLLAGLGAVIVLMVVLARHSRQQQRTNQALESSLAELKVTQEQLVQREKMAFLGELTAGIAHELQNPLNFVKNFAEVSTDLIDGINGLSDQPQSRDAGLEQEILNGLKQNLQNISQHGQRASAIIKGMLEHSRSGSGQRELTDLNALVAENLRLAYQGLRTHEKNFTATLTTDLDPALTPVHIIAQDLGRVLLNICTNAFYAVQQRQKLSPDGQFEPEVRVTTRQGPGSVEIRVRDNGTGIPDSVKAKIFQPFFTTKPVGEGTGLGLSLSHDIVTTGHGGTLAVESQEGQGTEFVVTLPVTNPIAKLRPLAFS
jgi:two-component system NtrC family sensor kinase